MFRFNFQMPVPLQRNMPNSNRRSEYVNMPVGMPSVNPNPMPTAHDLHSLSSASPDLSNPPPLPPHNYANMPLNKNPMPPPREDPVSNNSSQGQQPGVSNNRKFSQFRQTHQSTHRFNDQSSDQEPLSYNDTQTLRADQRLEYPPPPKEEGFFGNSGSNGMDLADGPGFKPQFRQIHLDYDSRQQNETKAEPQQAASRVPLGHARRENRASLRAKHKKEMEQANTRVSCFCSRMLILLLCMLTSKFENFLTLNFVEIPAEIGILQFFEILYSMLLTHCISSLRGYKYIA